MTDVEKMQFLLSHTIQVAGMLYAQAIGSDLRKTSVQESDGIRETCISHATAVVHDTVNMHRYIFRRRGTADLLDPIKEDLR